MAVDYVQKYKSLESKLGFTLKHIALTTSAVIDEEKHSKINQPGDENIPEFKEIKKIMNEIMVKNQLTPETFYTFKVHPDKSISFAMMLHKKTFVGDKYQFAVENQRIFRDILNGYASQSKLYTDEFGVWLSGYAPIKNKKDQVTGIIEVDYRVERFFKDLQEEIFYLVVSGIVILLLGVSIIFWISLSIARPIVKIRLAFKDIVDGKYDFRFHDIPRNEIGDLKIAYNEVSSSLEERLLMFQYIPKHTIDMISSLVRKGGLEQAVRRKITILFSDVRGFTQFSEARDPKDVLGTLNSIIGIQADIINEYNGRVDKFVGDEVVSFFDGENQIESCILAAIEMQKQINEAIKTMSYEKEISIGIGINTGEVIMGNLGSKDRKEYSMMGSHVNLASRVVNVAKPRQILITENIVKELSEDLRRKYNVTYIGKSQFKGITKTSKIYSIS